jgi:hypothetical protein
MQSRKEMMWLLSRLMKQPKANTFAKQQMSLEQDRHSLLDWLLQRALVSRDLVFYVWVDFVGGGYIL